jgi:hypothetical protein
VAMIAEVSQLPSYVPYRWKSVTSRISMADMISGGGGAATTWHARSEPQRNAPSDALPETNGNISGELGLTCHTTARLR